MPIPIILMTKLPLKIKILLEILELKDDKILQEDNYYIVEIIQ